MACCAHRVKTVVRSGDGPEPIVIPSDREGSRFLPAADAAASLGLTSRSGLG